MSDLTLFTVSYNHLSAKLPRLLHSIDKYLSDYAEHIVWDNNSSDGTQPWLLSLKRPKTFAICSKQNINDLPAYNKMAKRCQTKYFMAINPNTRITGPFDIQVVLQSFKANPKLVLIGNFGPTVRFADVTPEGVGGWGWVPRLLIERDLVQPEDVDCAHIQTHCFFADKEKFLELGRFQFQNRLFDMREPTKRFPEKPLDLLDKGNMITSEVELSVRARRMGFEIGHVSPWPFYHYFSTGQQSTVEGLDGEDARLGLSPLGYEFGMFNEGKFLRGLA